MVMPVETACPWRTKFMRPAYSPSPNLSRISCSRAASALSASLPSASIFTVEPMPAASIITPMMLLALTRRPLREIQISHSKPPASWVSLADARACRPSLLTMAASELGIQTPVGVHVHQALGAAGQRALDGRRQRAVAAGEHAQQHRQRDARHAFDAAVVEQVRNGVAGRGAEDVGEDQHAVALVEVFQQLARAQRDLVRVVVARHAERGHQRRHAAEDLPGAGEQRLADGAVGDDQHADHASLFSSASRNRPATSVPDWSWISRKPVGLVTLTSVIQSPMTSRPTSSKPLCESTGPSSAAISRCRAVTGWATPFAPAARLPRDSPGLGMRARQCGTILPSIRITRLSPSLISGMYFCAITLRVPREEMVSTIEFRLGSSCLTMKIPVPPMPSRRLSTVTLCSSTKACNSCMSRATREGTVQRENSAIANFSLWSRNARG